MGWILFLLPDEFLPLICVGVSLAVVLQIITIRRALTIIGAFVLLIIFSPFFESFIGSLLDLVPLWIVMTVVFVIGFILLRLVLEFVLGREAIGHVVFSILAFSARMVFRFLVIPFRLANGLVRLFLTRRAGRVQ